MLQRRKREAGDSNFGDEFEESRSDPPKASDLTEDSDSYEESDVPSRPHEPDQWRGQEYKLLQTLRATSSAERHLKATELDSSKKFSQSDQKEAALAMERLERARRRQNKYQLRANVVKAARALASIKKNLKLNKIMVDWIEQQNPVISARYGTSIHDDTEGNNNQRLTKNARSQKHSEFSLLPHNGPSLI